MGGKRCGLRLVDRERGAAFFFSARCRPALKSLKPSCCNERKFNDLSAKTLALKSFNLISIFRFAIQTVSPDDRSDGRIGRIQNSPLGDG
jgi:hypothetical protein